MNNSFRTICISVVCFALLTGITLSGYADVLCVSEDGHIELETQCLPCCDDSNTNCEIFISEEAHDQHDQCNDCSDLELNRIHWSKRLRKLSPEQHVTTQTYLSKIEGNNFHLLQAISDYPLEFSLPDFQNHSLVNKATTVLSC